VVLPPLLLWLVYRLGYDSRALIASTVLCWIVLIVCYRFTDPSENVNWVFGTGSKSRTRIGGLPFVLYLMVVLPLLIYFPTHILLTKLMPHCEQVRRAVSADASPSTEDGPETGADADASTETIDAADAAGDAALSHDPPAGDAGPCIAVAPTVPPLWIAPVAATSFTASTFAAQTPGSDDWYVVEQAGQIRIIRKGHVLPSPFLDVSAAMGTNFGERGLLSVAFHPNYAQNGRFFVMGTPADGSDGSFAPANAEFAAHIGLYTPCNVAYRDNDKVTAKPIRLFHGITDDWVSIEPCRNYAARLKQAGADVALTDNVGVKVLMHTGAASATTYAAPVTVFTQSPNFNVVGGNIIAIADVDGDGLNDLLITDPGPTGGMSPAVYVLLQDPANHGTFLSPVGYAIATQDRPQSIVLKDLEGTGKLDIVIGARQSVTVLLHDPANPGKFLPASIYPAADADEIAVSDINGDGKLDIVVSNGVTYPMQGGVSTTHPGVLLQSATTPGTFGPLQDLP